MDLKTKKIIIILSALGFLSVSTSVYFLFIGNAEYRISRTIKYQYLVRNKSNKFIEKSEFWAYAPVPKTSNQLVLSINSSHPFESEYDKLGNHIQTFSIKNLAPFATKIITLTISLSMSDKANRIELKNKKQFTSAEKILNQIIQK